MSQMIRPRRNRKDDIVRAMVRETVLSLDDFIAPLFVMEGQGVRQEIPSMPGQFRLSIDQLEKEVGELVSLGIKAVCLFPVIAKEKKDRLASESLNRDGVYLRALDRLKQRFSNLIIMTDVAMDPYSSDGHDGLVENGKIVNDATVEILTKMALAQAAVGSDIIGPSDMMDGRVGAIRRGLDGEGFVETSIMSYTAKYASSFYGPFRDALDSAPRSGDKKTYQMDYSNGKEALLEARLDQEEGADFLMVKPGLAYLDIISKMKAQTLLPIAVYNVSGEYAMVKAAAAKGWVEEQAVVIEMMTAFKRAGSDIILTYFAKDMARYLNGY